MVDPLPNMHEDLGWISRSEKNNNLLTTLQI